MRVARLENSDGSPIKSLSTVVKTGSILSGPDVEMLPPSDGQPPPGYRAYLGVPLRLMSGEVIGTICSFHHDCRPFTSEQICAAQLFAERAATLC